MGGRNPGSWHRVGCMADGRMAHGKAYCSFGEGTAKRRAQCTERRAVHMGSCTCCARSNFHMVSDRGGNRECKAPGTCESKSGDAHSGENMGYGTVPDNTCRSSHDRHGHTLAVPYKGSYMQAPPYGFCKSTHLAGCGHTSVLR